MTTDPTREEIERGARTIAHEHGSTVFDDDHVPYEYTEHERDQYRAEACAVMVEDRAALMAAGRLLPEPLETRTEWGIRLPDQPDYVTQNSPDPRRWAQHNVTVRRERGIAAVLIRREMRTYPDWSTWVGPWVAVDPDTKEGP